jgi:hypothetical protein
VQLDEPTPAILPHLNVCLIQALPPFHDGHKSTEGAVELFVAPGTEILLHQTRINSVLHGHHHLDEA